MGNPVEASAPPPSASYPVQQQSYNAAPPPAYGAPPGQPPVMQAYGMPAVQQGYAPGQMAPPTTVIVQQPARPVMYGQNPQRMNCLFCNQDIVTKTTADCGTGSWVICLALAFFTGCCCCWPMCCDGCKDTVHTCPNCNRQLGRRNLM